MQYQGNMIGMFWPLCIRDSEENINQKILNGQCWKLTVVCCSAALLMEHMPEMCIHSSEKLPGQHWADVIYAVHWGDFRNPNSTA